MAFSHGTDARMWLDGYPISCVTSDFDLDAKTDDAETSTLCNTFKTYIPGLESAEAKIKGLLDGDSVTPTSTFEYVLENRRRQIVPLVYHPQTGTLGAPAYLVNGFLDDFKISTGVKDAAKFEVKFQSNTGVHTATTPTTATTGIVLKADSVITATADGTSVDQTTATTAYGAAAILSVSAVSGTTPTLDVIVQHSTNNSVWVDLITFSQENAVNGQYLETTATTTVNRYVRAKWTVAGGTPSFTFNVAFRRK